jgi:hypothetical protein
MPTTTFIQTILSAFAAMDIDGLRLFLKDKYTYQETTKKIFLNKIEEVFEAYKNSGDTELLVYKGACSGSKKCDNCGKKGYRFVGNHSKNYMDLLFEIESDNIKDIFDCMHFKTDVDIENLGMKADIDVNLGEQISGTINYSPMFGQ